MFFRARVKSYRRSPLAAWAEVDWLLLVACVALTGLGGIMIRSVEVTQGLTDWWQHWITGGVGLILAMIIAKSNYQTLINWKWIVYIIVNLSLIAVQFIGTTALGAQRWINIGGFHVQPSEFAKVGIIIVLAALLHEVKIPSIPDTIKMLIIAAVPWALVLIEPNLGTSLVFGMITLGMLYWGNVHPGWLILLLSPICAAILTTVYQPAGIIWAVAMGFVCLLYTSPSPRDRTRSRMPSSA